MFYTITGSNKKQRVLADTAVAFAVERLSLPDKVTINVKLSRARLEDGNYGYCDYQGTYYRRHIVDIVVHSLLSESEFVSTIFHELKHAEQFCDGSLSPDLVSWKGRDYSESNAYRSLPWEISARGFEERLLNRWYDVYGEFENTETSDAS